MNLELTDEETAALLRELDGLIDVDRYFLSRRIKTLIAIRPRSGQSRFASLCRPRQRAMNHREQPQRKDGVEDAKDKIHPTASDAACHRLRDASVLTVNRYAPDKLSM
jgi:hypothetical protein